MSRTESIAHRLREVCLQGKWVANTNYKELLKDISWEQATKKINNLNTIAELTFHVNYYLDGLITVFKDGKLEIRDKFSFDLPPVTSQQDWENLVGTFLTNAETFAHCVEQMKDHKLDAPFVEEKYGTYLQNVEGIIDHCYYHLGQISLLKKLLNEDGRS